MASPIAFPLNPGFDLQTVVGELGRVFQVKGYTVRSYPLGAGACLEISKNLGGLNTVLGRCEGLKVNFMPGATLLNVSFSDEQWTDKIIGFVVGWFTCWIPWIFTLIGLYSQSQLPKIVESELRRLLGTVGVPGTAYYTPPGAETGAQTYQYYQTYQSPVYPASAPPQPTPYTAPTGAGYAPPSEAAPQPAAQQPVTAAPPPEAVPPDPFGVSAPPPASSPFDPNVPAAPSVPNPFKEGNPYDNPFEAAPAPAPERTAPFTCRVCGKELASDSVFCNHCGARQ